MTSIITGDIISSKRQKTATWLEELKVVLQSIGKSPADWEIYRGDEFQIEINPEDALFQSVRIKAFLKTLRLDARIGIGIGEKEYSAKKITESNGSAFVRSGELFDNLRKDKVTLAINSSNAEIDQEINLMLRLSSAIMNNWLPQSGQFVRVAMENPNASQEELGQLLGINQAAVSRRQKRAQYELIMDVDAHYRNKIKTIFR